MCLSSGPHNRKVAPVLGAAHALFSTLFWKFYIFKKSTPPEVIQDAVEESAITGRNDNKGYFGDNHNVSPMKYISSDNRLRSRMSSCDSPPGEGGIRRVTPLDKGLSRSDWGLRQMDFEEILNDGSTNSLGASIINSSNRH